jgi:hypothetical protein
MAWAVVSTEAFVCAVLIWAVARLNPFWVDMPLQERPATADSEPASSPDKPFTIETKEPTIGLQV